MYAFYFMNSKWMKKSLNWQNLWTSDENMINIFSGLPDTNLSYTETNLAFHHLENDKKVSAKYWVHVNDSLPSLKIPNCEPLPHHHHQEDCYLIHGYCCDLGYNYTTEIETLGFSELFCALKLTRSCQHPFLSSGFIATLQCQRN